jgi:aryl-alcohol dehydrogenase-like predicted oxidoreductase
MDHRLFGRTDRTISSLALGTARFGWRTRAGDAAAILDLYRSRGGNLVETSAVWCLDLENAARIAAPGEHLVGRWLAEEPNRRRGVFLAGRVFLGARLCASTDFAAHLRANCEASLQRLNTEYFDLLQIEWCDDFGPIARLLEALWPLVRQSRILRLGAAGFPAWRIATANAVTQQAALPALQTVQAAFSLLDPRPFEREYAELCAEHRLAFLARAPLAASTLAQRVDSPPRDLRWAALRPSAHQLSVRERLAWVAQRRGATLAQTELAWVLSHPEVATAVVHATSPGQLAEWMQGAAGRLSHEEQVLLRHPWTPAPAVSQSVEPATERALAMVPG